MPDCTRTAAARFLPPRLVLGAGLAALALAGAALAGFAKNHALLINASPSLPYWAIWLERETAPQRGDLILFDPPPSPLLTRHFGKRPKPFGKVVLGIGGDIVTREGRSVLINGRAVAVLKPATRRGEVLVPGPLGIIPQHCFFAGTPHPDGFDSRYAAIGWVCASQVLGVGKAIL